MLDDIDYSSLSASETPSEKKKDEGISSRRMKSEKTSKAAQAAPVDVNAVVQRSQQLSADLGAPKPADGLSNYGTEILGGLGVLGALAAAHHHYTTNRPKLGESNAGMPPPAKPDMRNFGQQPTAPTAPPEPKYSPEIQALIDRSEANKAAKAADAAAKANPVPQGMTPSIPTGQPNVPSNPAGAFSQPSGYSQTAPQQTLTQAVETGGDVGQALKTDVAKMVDEASKPVYPKGESLKAVPPGFVFREDVGNLDRSLGNILGKEHREYARELFNQGKPFGHSPDLNTDVSKITNEYWKHLQSEIPQSLLGRDERRAMNIPSQFGTFAKDTNFGQKAKFAGKLGTLFAVADLANAKTPEERANAGINLLGAILPPGADINAAGAPTLSPQQVKANQTAYENQFKLGSPYAQTEAAKAYRLRERAGAGRGIAPPSAYR